MIEPISYIPEELRIGDTWFFKLTYQDFPASDWDCVAYFSSAIGAFSVTATDDGSGHLFTVAATTTADYEPGGYNYAVRVEHSTDGRVFTVGEGYVDLMPPLSVQADHRAQVKKVLDAIDAVIEGRANNDHLSVSVAGRSISKMSINELMEFRSWYSQRWETLKGKNRKQSFNRSQKNSIRARF